MKPPKHKPKSPPFAEMKRAMDESPCNEIEAESRRISQLIAYDEQKRLMEIFGEIKRERATKPARDGSHVPGVERGEQKNHP
jgi:hypothetical protein